MLNLLQIRILVLDMGAMNIGFVIGVLLAIALGVLLYSYLALKKQNYEQERRNRELLSKNSDLYDLNVNLKKENSSLKSIIKDFEKTITDLSIENSSLLEENVSLGESLDLLKGYRLEESDNVNKKEIVIRDYIVREQNQESFMKHLNTLYAEAIIDGCLAKISEKPSENSIYVLSLDGECDAFFSIYQPACQRIIANPSFIDGCDKQFLDDAVEIEVVSKGTARRDAANGTKWRIVNKLKVIIR